MIRLGVEGELPTLSRKYHGSPWAGRNRLGIDAFAQLTKKSCVVGIWLCLTAGVCAPDDGRKTLVGAVGLTVRG